MNEFPCDKCGACCMNVGRSVLTEYLDSGDGSCIFFEKETKLCKIYVKRPLVCRVKEFYLENYASALSWDFFVEINKKSCDLLKDIGRIE